MKEPPRKAELPGKDKITVPVEKPPSSKSPQEAKDEPNPVEQLNIPAKSLAAATDSLPGAIEAPPGPPTLVAGIGHRRRRGHRTQAPASVPGTGSGLGPGKGGGTGGGVYQPGNGVTLPRVLHEVKPQYTSDAMRAKVQGTVLLQCVVRPDGTVGDVQVVALARPDLRPRSGSHRTPRGSGASRPARAWAKPVPVLITIELTFTLR